MYILSLLADIVREYLLLLGYVSGGAAFPAALTPEEEREALERFAAGDTKARDELIEHNLRLVAHIAKKYSDACDTDDLISIGTIGLIKGINTFDTAKNARLSGYIARCIENEMRMYLRAGKKLRHEVSIDEVIGTDKEGNSMTFADILAADGGDVADEVSTRADAAQLVRVMERVLTPEECEIIAARYGLSGKTRMTQREVAEKLGISRSYVSRIEKRCLGKLAEELR